MAGSAGRPRTSDSAIADGIRQALIADPRASMAEIARTAGVGMSAIYLRFPSRIALLRHFADEANAIYDQALTRVEHHLEAGGDPCGELERFVMEITESGLHRLGVAIAGTFVRSPEDVFESVRLRDRGRRLIEALHARGVLRPGVTWEDLGKAIEALGSVEGADAERTATLRARMIDIVVTGLTAGSQPLAGSAANAADFRENRPPDPVPAEVARQRTGRTR